MVNVVEVQQPMPEQALPQTKQLAAEQTEAP